MIVKAESSKYELARSVSTSIEAGLTLFKISASIKYGFESETSSSKEMAYTAVLAICRREKQYLDPNLDDQLATLRSALQSGFARDLNGPEAVISLPDEFGNISPYHVIPQDLNEGTKALSNVDLCYTRGSNHTPVTTIGTDLNADCSSNRTRGSAFIVRGPMWASAPTAREPAGSAAP